MAFEAAACYQPSSWFSANIGRQNPRYTIYTVSCFPPTLKKSGLWIWTEAHLKWAQLNTRAGDFRVQTSRRLLISRD